MKAPYVSQENRIRLNFDSLTAFGQHVKALDDRNVIDSHGKRSADDASKRPPKDDWDLNTDFDSAVSRVILGGHWPEGCQKLKKAIADAPAAVHMVPTEELSLDRIGAAVDVGEYLQNSPDCMLYFDAVPQAKPVIKIGVISNISASTTVDEAMNKGRGILSVIEALEAQGKSVELTAILIAESGKRIKGYEVQIKIKTAEQPLNLESIAFAIAHPAFSRRLGFRIAEAYTARVTHDCYGNSKESKIPGFDILFGYQIGGCETPQKGLDYALNELKRFNRQQKRRV